MLCALCGSLALFLRGALARGSGLDFFQAMAGVGVEIKAVKLLQLADAFEGSWTECSLAVEGVQDDALEDVAERQVVIFAEGFQDFEDSFFDAYAGLDALD